MRLLDKEVKLLREIETALGKFELGTYGICQEQKSKSNAKDSQLVHGPDIL